MICKYKIYTRLIQNLPDQVKRGKAALESLGQAKDVQERVYTAEISGRLAVGSHCSTNTRTALAHNIAATTLHNQHTIIA